MTSQRRVTWRGEGEGRGDSAALRREDAGVLQHPEPQNGGGGVPKMLAPMGGGGRSSKCWDRWGVVNLSPVRPYSGSPKL